MSDERVLLLGNTGVEKETAINKLKQYRENIKSKGSLQYVSFESNLDTDLLPYLDSNEDAQRRHWLRAWDRTAQELKDIEAEIVILGMHGVLTRSIYGSRSPAIVRRIVEDFRPTKIISLIQDVYIHQYRTSRRAGEKDYKGKPDSVQLLEARRSSIFLGDLINNQSSAQGIPINHYTISAWHPAQVLNSVLSDYSHSSVYLAFPITEPRERLREGDGTLKNTLNEKFQKIYNYSFQRDTEVFFFTPLTIDEYPYSELLKSLDICTDEEQNVTFDMNERWSIRDFIEYKEPLLTEESSIPSNITLEVSGRESASTPGLISADVRYRDYKLVRQSDYVGVVNPIFPGMTEISGGVDNEIQHAFRNATPVHIYQDDELDENGIIEDKFSNGGSLGLGDLSRMVVVYNDLRRWLESFE